MFTRIVSLLALTSAALAVPSLSPSPHASIGSISAFLTASSTLDKRQSEEPTDVQGLRGYAELLQRASRGQQCDGECNPWVEFIQGCVRTGGGYDAIGICSCRDEPTELMRTCVECFEEPDTGDDIATVCARAVAQSSESEEPDASSTPPSSTTASNTPGSDSEAPTTSSGEPSAETEGPVSGAVRKVLGAGVGVGVVGLAALLLA